MQGFMLPDASPSDTCQLRLPGKQQYEAQLLLAVRTMTCHTVMVHVGGKENLGAFKQLDCSPGLLSWPMPSLSLRCLGCMSRFTCSSPFVGGDKEVTEAAVKAAMQPAPHTVDEAVDKVLAARAKQVRSLQHPCLNACLWQSEQSLM